jgi:transcriptional regulator with XRE-family HTH domain
MAGRHSNKTPSQMGARIAALRNKAGLSQAQLAEIIGIPQRTLSFYEREAGDIPAGLVPVLAKALDVSLEEVLGVNQSAGKKRGPKSQLERQLEAVADLPRSQQQQILNVVQALIAQAQSAS